MKHQKYLISLIVLSLIFSVVNIEAFQAKAEENAQEIIEADSYEEFINTQGEVAIDPSKLTADEMIKLGLNPAEYIDNYKTQVNSVFRAKKVNAPQYGKIYGKKKWSKKISKSKIQAVGTTAGGIITIVGSAFPQARVVSLAGGIVGTVSGIIGLKNVKGVKLSGTAVKKLVRKNPYQTPSLGSVYKVTKVQRF